MFTERTHKYTEAVCVVNNEYDYQHKKVVTSALPPLKNVVSTHLHKFWTKTTIIIWPHLTPITV